MINQRSECYYRLALCNAAQHNLSKAVVLARRALQLDADNEKARRLLGLCLYELGEFGQAADALENIQELYESAHAEHARTAELLSQVRQLAKRKKWRKAEASLRKFEPQNVRTLLIRGCVSAAAKDFKPAAVFFARALEKDKGSAIAGVYLGEVYEKLL